MRQYCVNAPILYECTYTVWMRLYCVNAPSQKRAILSDVEFALGGCSSNYSTFYDHSPTHLRPCALQAANNVKLIAIGMEETLDDFVEGHFFKGDLFVDHGR
jgi:hypothetical protein